MKSVNIGEKGKLGWRKVTSALAALALGVTGITAAAVFSGSEASAEEAPGTSEATAIYKPGTPHQKQGYEGKAWIDYDQETHILNTKAGDKALPGLKIFLQWMNGKGVVSPIYYTTSDPEGNFYFDLSEPVVDGLGNKHEYILYGDANFKVRVWAQNPDPEKFTVVKTGDVFGASFHTRTKRVNESWDFTVGINRIVGGQVVFQERPNQFDWLAKPEAEWSHAPSSDGVWNDGGIYGTVRGQVWWQVDEPAGSMAYKYDYNPNRGDRAATGVKIVASYLNDELTRQLDAWKEANRGWTVEMMRQEQIRLFTEYQAEHGVGSHIAETVVAPVTADTYYYIPFQGLWGRTAYNDGGVPAGKTWGELTGEHRHNDVLLWNTLAGFNRRHYNTDYMYVFPIVDGKQDMWRNSFTNNIFSNPNDGNLGEGSPTSLDGHNLANVTFAFLSPNPEHDVTNYDNSQNIAIVGDVAESETTGLAPFTEYTIQWFKTDKKVTMGPVEGASCTFQTAADGAWRTDAGELASCDLTVPDIESATTFVSAVYGGTDVSGVNLLADSFLAIPGYYEYVPQEDVVKAKVQTSPAIFDNPETQFAEKKPGDATFTFAEPDAAAALQLTLDATTGAVTWPVATQYVGKLVVPVEMKASIESYTAGMGARSMPTGTKAISDGKYITLPGKAVFVLTPPNVSYTAATVDQGSTADLPAVITDNDGKAAELPAETTFALGENAPAWATIDAATGKISVAPGAEVTAQDYTIPVLVTFKNVTDPVATSATVTVTVPPDADGDNVPDSKDQCAGTPTGVTVDANGCAVGPTIEDPAAITGKVNEPITDIEVPVTNNGGYTDLTCEATGLPAGLTVTYDAVKGACVISGTPTEEVTDQEVTITVTGKTPELHSTGTRTHPESGTHGYPPRPTSEIGTTTATIGAENDADGDNVPDSKDLCPAVAGEADNDGCPYAKITGHVFHDVNKDQVLNAGETDISGVTLTLTPSGATATTASPYTFDGVKIGTHTVTVGDVANATATTPKTITIEVKAGDTLFENNNFGFFVDADGDGVEDSKDQCEDTPTTIPAGFEVDANGCLKDVAKPVITPIDDATETAKTPITPIEVEVTDNAGDDKVTVEVAGLPDGVTYDKTTGTISGTPSENGTYEVTVTAKDEAGNTAEETFTLTVGKNQSGPTIEKIKDQTVWAGDPITDITVKVTDAEDAAAGKAPTVKVDGLPAGVTFDAATGVISGAPTDATGTLAAPGSVTITVTATDSDGNVATTTFKITANDPNADSDNDGLTDKEEVEDHKTDPLNPDTDKDGLTDGEEINGDKNDFDDKSDPNGKPGNTDPLNPDSDGDGVNDGDEVNADNPTNPNAADTDNDGLTDKEEKDHGTDPLNPDTDKDGLTDGEEVNGTENPFQDDKYDPNGKPGNTNPLNPDTDGDGLTDGEEVTGSANNGKPTNPNRADTDGDGIADGTEIENGTDPLDPNDPAKPVAPEKPKAPLANTGAAIGGLLGAMTAMLAAGGVAISRRYKRS